MVRELFEKEGRLCKFFPTLSERMGTEKWFFQRQGDGTNSKKHVILLLMVSEIRRSPPGMYKSNIQTLLIMGHLPHQLVSRIFIHQRYYHLGQGGPLTPLIAAVSLLGTWLDQQTKYIGLLFACGRITLPKFNSSPLKMDGWKTILSYWEGNFSGANC